MQAHILKKGYKQLKNLPLEQRKAALDELDNLEVLMKDSLLHVVSADPFWFYEPTTSKASQAAYDFARKYLKDEDIPQVFDSQSDVHYSTAGTNAVSGGNQSGKSTVCAIETFIKITGEVPGSLKANYPKEKIPTEWPRHYRVTCEDYTNGMLKNVIPTFQRWCPKQFLLDGKWDKAFSSKDNTLRLTKDHKIIGTVEFMSNQQEVGSFQGPPRHGLVYDEEPRRDIHKENLMRLATSSKGKLDIIFGMTPTKGMTWVYDDIFSKANETEEIKWFKLPSFTNPAANLKTLGEILENINDYSERKMRLLGEFISLSGLVYGSSFHPRIHVIPPFEITRDYYVVRGFDPHFVKPTAVVWIAIDREGQAYVIDCYQRQADTDQIKVDMARMGRHYRLGWSACDMSSDVDIKAFSNRNILRELTTKNNAVRGMRKSSKWAGSIAAGVDDIKKRLKVNQNTQKPGLMFFDTPNVKPLIHSMRTLERDAWMNEDQKGTRDKIKEGKHDLHAAMRYVFQHPINYVGEQVSVPEYHYVDAEAGW